MKIKIIGIFVCMLFIAAAVLPVVESLNKNKNHVEELAINPDGSQVSNLVIPDSNPKTTDTKIELSTDLLNERVTKTSSTKQDVLLDEDFSGEFPPSGWSTDFWEQSNTNEAGGTSPEGTWKA